MFRLLYMYMKSLAVVIRFAVYLEAHTCTCNLVLFLVTWFFHAVVWCYHGCNFIEKWPCRLSNWYTIYAVVDSVFFLCCRTEQNEEKYGKNTCICTERHVHKYCTFVHIHVHVQSWQIYTMTKNLQCYVIKINDTKIYVDFDK